MKWPVYSMLNFAVSINFFKLFVEMLLCISYYLFVSNFENTQWYLTEFYMYMVKKVEYSTGVQLGRVFELHKI